MRSASKYPALVGGAVVLLATIGWSADAAAQSTPPNSSLALSRFNPAPVGDRFFGIPYPAGNGDVAPHAGLLGDYAFEPLVLDEFADDGSDAAIVDSQFLLHAGAAFSLGQRLNINMDLPFELTQSGEGAVVDGRTLDIREEAAVGDLRLGARLTAFGEFEDPFQAAMGVYFWMPTGEERAMMSTGTVRAMPHLVFGGCVEERVIWSATAGVDVRDEATYAGVSQGVAINWGAGVAAFLDDHQRLQLGPEFYMASVAEDAVSQNLNGEVLLGFRGRPLTDLELGLALGPGFTDAIGTPTVRTVFSVAYTPKMEKSKDRDGDGIEDHVDACPDVPGVASSDPSKHGCPPPGDRDADGIIDEQDACPDIKGIPSDDPKKHGCPPPGDRDGDGIVDEKDACPDVPGVPSDDPKKNGCPSDRDEDGIIDAEDACPDVAGPKRDDPKTNGCPDRDEDGIMDAVDACPDEKGVPSPDPAKNGCPAKVVVTEKEIKILQKVEFDFNKATIKPVSNSLLDEVAAVMKDYPEITKIEVQGHTDSKGSDAHNKLLSQRRAEAVQKALVSRGVDEGRLSNKGYGEEEPIASNDTDEGRAQNRRVQFKILERKKKAPEAP